jgi:regulator of sigma E protease
MLGIINLIPWPILDGGHILYMIVEKIRGKKLEPERWYLVQTFGLAVLVFLAVFLVYFDFARILANKLP